MKDAFGNDVPPPRTPLFEAHEKLMQAQRAALWRLLFFSRNGCFEKADAILTELKAASAQPANDP